VGDGRARGKVQAEKSCVIFLSFVQRAYCTYVISEMQCCTTMLTLDRPFRRYLYGRLKDHCEGDTLQWKEQRPSVLSLLLPKTTASTVLRSFILLQPLLLASLL